jgi:hypothetical protein
VEKVLPAFDSKALQARLARLDHKQRLAFGASCCERLLPNYSAFQQDAGWGDISPVRRSLDFVWSFLYRESIDLEEAERITAACEAVAPSSDDCESLYVTAAQDACFAVCGLLDCLRHDDVERIVQVATYATDSVDLYVQEVENMAANDPQLEQKILAHRLMQRELSTQEQTLALLEQSPSVSSELLDQIKALWDNEGRSNLDLPKAAAG